MYSVVLIIFGVAFIMFPILFAIGPNEEKHNKEEQKKRTKKTFIVFGVFVTVLVVICSIIIITLVSQRNTAIEGCYGIDIPTTDEMLYYDEVKDEYFFLVGSDWDLTKLFERDVLDYETGKSIKESNDIILDAMENIKEKLR